MTTYRTLYTYFQVIDQFGRRELPRELAINTGVRVMRLREYFQAAEEQRLILVKKHAVLDEDGQQSASARGQVALRDPTAFEREWTEMLDTDIEDYPEWSKKIQGKLLPSDVTAIEVEGLLRLGMLETEELWD